MNKIPLYIDFDRVLFDTDYLKNQICNLYIRYGFTEENTLEGYRQAGTDRRYTPEKHVAALRALQPEITVPEVDLVQGAYALLSNFLYPHTMEFLEQLNRTAYSPILLTLGEPEFQQAKVDKTGIAALLDQVITCRDEKWDHLKTMHQPEDRFVLIDDRLDAIEIISKEFPNSFGIFKDVYEQYPSFSDPRFVRVTTFEEILDAQLPEPFPSLRDHQPSAQPATDQNPL